MILNMDRDDVPHFMEHLTPEHAPDSPESLACTRAELDWLAQHGLTFISVPFNGSYTLDELLAQLRGTGDDAPVVLGCNTSAGVNHSVVIWRGEVYNPSAVEITGPMNDGLWWITVYSVGPNWMSREATREVAFRAGYEAALDHMEPSGPIGFSGTVEQAWSKFNASLATEAATR